MFDILKLFIASVASVIFSYLQPLHNLMFALFVIYAVDIFFGILADLIVNKARLSIKKFLNAIVHFAMYLFVIIIIYLIGEKMGDQTEILFVNKIITYFLIYLYFSNFLKNAKILFPNSRFIAFLDYYIGLQFASKIPHLGYFLEKEKKEKENEKD